MVMVLISYTACCIDRTNLHYQAGEGNGALSELQENRYELRF
jgi:hypothetical protein